MNRSLFITSIVTSICFTTIKAAAAQPRIAIKLTSDSTLGERELERLLDVLSGRLLSSHRCQIVDRKRLSAVIAEQGFSNSDYADPQTAAALGRIVGASRLLHVDVSANVEDTSGQLVSKREVEISASFQLVSVDTARIIASGTADGTADRSGTSTTSSRRLLDQALDDCADDLAQQLGSSL